MRIPAEDGLMRRRVAGCDAGAARGIYNALKKQGESQVEGVRAVSSSAGSAGNDTKCVVQIKWAGLDESGVSGAIGKH